MSRMTDERLREMRQCRGVYGCNTPELLDALVTERAEVERLRTRMHVLDRQEWFQRSVGEAGSSEGWTIEVPETDDAAADLRLLLGMEDGK